MPLLVIALIVVPLLELWVIIKVGGLIGALPTILLLLACSLGGAWLVRREGRAAWRRFTESINAGRIPARETADGAMIVLGGALLLTPGFLTDICGLLLLTRPIRDLIRSFALARAVGGGWRGFAVAAARQAGSRRRRDPGSEPPPRRAYDFEGSAVEVDPERPQRFPELPETPRGNR